MPLNTWSEQITIAELSNEPMFSEDMDSLMNRIDEIRHDDDEGVPNVIVDLSQVNTVNSSNLGALLRLRKTLINAKKRLLLCRVGDGVWTAMIATGLDRVFEFTEDTTTALAALQLDI
jgi:anti-anti-sigma factor